MKRRDFLVAGAALATTGALAGYTRYLEPEWLEVTRRRLPVRGLPAALRGKTLVQLSDIHVSPQVHDHYVAQVFDRVRALAPDIVVFTGDFVSLHDGMLAHAERVYAGAPRGRLGTVGVFGNHDYGRDWQQPEIADRLQRILAAHGIGITRNDVSVVADLQFVCVDDLWAGRYDAAGALRRADPRAAMIALSHNPDTVDLTGWGEYRGWILSGHTHGGQCKPPFLPPPLLPVRNRRYTSGEFALGNGRTLYINRGIGTTLPVRFNARPEVTLFTLESA